MGGVRGQADPGGTKDTGSTGVVWPSVSTPRAAEMARPSSDSWTASSGTWRCRDTNTTWVSAILRWDFWLEVEQGKAEKGLRPIACFLYLQVYKATGEEFVKIAGGEYAHRRP